MEKALIKIKDLHLYYKVFEGQLHVLDGINLDIGYEERLGLIGESGCGKSTLMKLIINPRFASYVGMVKGEIIFNQKNLLGMSIKKRKELMKGKISMIYQEPFAALNPVFTIGTQIQDVIRYSNFLKKYSKKEMKDLSIELLNRVFIPDPDRVLGYYPCQLSGGMCQRVCIALAIQNSREILIADEPGTALDATTKVQILRLLNKLVSETKVSTILVSHDLASIKNFTDKIIVMYAGTIVEVAKIKEFFDEPLHPYSKALIASLPRLNKVTKITGLKGQIPDYYNPPLGCRFFDRCDYRMEICGNRKPPFFEFSKTRKVACFLYKSDFN